MPSAPNTAEARPQPADPLAPSVSWCQLTEAPLSGLCLAREAGLVLAWDDSHSMYLFNLDGKLVSQTRTPVPLNCATISDDGTQIVAVSREGDLWWLNRGLDPRLHQGRYRHLIGVALSPHGEYLAAGMSDNHTYVFDCLGRRCTNLLTHRPLRHLVFLAGQALLVGAAEYGLVGCYELNGEPRWQDALWSSAGHLSASGEGYAILVSCFGHGLQRYGLDGTNEGAYHLGGGVARAVTDYDGKFFAAATLEGEILVVNAAGHVLWREALAKPAREIAFDAAGQFLIYGQETGAITYLSLYGAERPTTAPELPAEPARATEPRASERPAAAQTEPTSASRQLREPTWKVPAFDSESQAETAVLGLVENPIRVAVFSNRRRVEVFDDMGQRIHASDMMSGVGRYVETDAQMIIAATDRELLRYDVAGNDSYRFERRFTQISHLRIDSEAGEIALIEERDRLSRWDLAGNRRWIKSIDVPVEGFALGPNRTCAVTTEDGRLIVSDGDKRTIGGFESLPREALGLARIGSRWITLAGKAQKVRCHQMDGQVEWEVLLPTEAWRLIRLASRVAARSAAGRIYVLDITGRMVLDSTDVPAEATLFLDRNDEPSALFCRAGNLMITDLVGRVRWRHISTETMGPVAAGAAGVACALGRQLCFFGQ